MAFARGARYGIFTNSILVAFATRAKRLPYLASLSQIKYRGLSSYGVASRSCCATQPSVGWRVTPKCTTRRELNAMMKKTKAGRKRRSSTGKVASPHRIGMILQEDMPRLTGWSRRSNSSHVLLNRALRHPYSQLEQLPSNAFGTPSAILTCELLNQSDEIGADLSALRFGPRLISRTTESPPAASARASRVG